MMTNKKIEISWSDSEIERKISINNKMLDDFTNFKKNNELRFCVLHQSKINDFKTVDTVWCITTRYNESEFEKIKSDFKLFCYDNLDDNCQITKMTCQENIYVVEYSVFRHYEINHKS